MGRIVENIEEISRLKGGASGNQEHYRRDELDRMARFSIKR